MNSDKEYSFGPFRFVPAQHLLLHGDIPLRVGSRALEILQVLIEAQGELVSKQELFQRVWPKSVVEESNLKVHVAALRRALGEQKDDNNYIVTITGRGYRFAAPVSSVAAAVAAVQLHLERDCWLNLPAPLSRMVGRSQTVGSLLQTLEKNRLVSIVGPGGIGKTTVALTVATEFSRQQGVEVCFVDFSPLSDGRFVASAVAAALGLPIHSGDGAPAVVASLRERRLLLVMDSCEHVIDDAAVLAARIAGAAPDVQVLATSREPLRTAGEHVHRLAPLVYPAERQDIDAAQAMAFPAVQLFVERASESIGGYALSDADALAVVEICRRLEGNALAIELAATRVDAFGARELAARLDDRFQLLKRGRRSALERHNTLTAAMDWSYDFLSPAEQSLLRSLAMFSGGFTLDAAVALCAGSPDEEDGVIETVANLVAKSLLAADVGGPLVYYRLLDTTRAYALDKLEQLGEMEAMRRRHAECMCALFDQAASEWDAHPTEDWLACYVRRLDDVRNALCWAFSAQGELCVGISLTIAAIPLWMYLSLLEECRESVRRALASGHAQPREEMKLQAALAATILYAHGPTDETRSIWGRSLELADALDDSECQLRALWGLAIYHCYAGDYDTVQALAARLRVIAGYRSDRLALVSVDRVVGTALHYGGEQAAARRELERMLEHYVSPQHCVHLARYQLDQRSAALGTLANILWLQGYPEQAMQATRQALQEVRDAEHILSVVTTFTQSALPVMLNVGDHAGAAALMEELSGYLQRHALPSWSTLLHGLDALLKIQRGDPSGIHLLHDDLDTLAAAGYHLRFNSYLGMLAAALGAHGRNDEGLEVISQALACCEKGNERWCHAELLRIKGTLLEERDAVAAEAHYRQALSIARQQGALSWELRAATSLAKLKMRRGAAAEGQELLRAVYSQFTEGFDTFDLRYAKALADGREPRAPRVLIQ